jgi:hypothetical protein
MKYVTISWPVFNSDSGNLTFFGMPRSTRLSQDRLYSLFTAWVASSSKRYVNLPLVLFLRAPQTSSRCLKPICTNLTNLSTRRLLHWQRARLGRTISSSCLFTVPCSSACQVREWMCNTSLPWRRTIPPSIQSAYWTARLVPASARGSTMTSAMLFHTQTRRSCNGLS